MKRFSDGITVAAFFAILAMFAVSVIFFRDNGSIKQIVADEPDMRSAVTHQIERSFPLKNNWHSMHDDLMLFTGRRLFGDIYLTDDRLVRVDNSVSEDKMIMNIAYVNELAANTESPIYMMLVPTAAGVYGDNIPEALMGKSQREMINDAYMQLDRRIASIDAFYPLYSAKDEYVYYRTEDLWTSFGAYYAYCESIKTLGESPKTLENYDQEYALTAFYGDMYSRAMVSGLDPDRINIFRSKVHSPVKSVVLTKGDDVKEADSVYFKSALKTSSKTDIFLMGDNYTKCDIYNDLPGSPTLLIIKGSFANTIVPYYTAHYRKITMVDPDGLKAEGKDLSEVVDPDEYDRILVLYDIDSFSTSDSLTFLK